MAIAYFKGLFTINITNYSRHMVFNGKRREINFNNCPSPAWQQGCLIFLLTSNSFVTHYIFHSLVTKFNVKLLACTGFMEPELHVNRKTMIYNTLFVKLTLLSQEMPLSWNDKTHNNNNNNYWSHLGFKLLTQIILCKFYEYFINSLWKMRQSFSENEQERNAKCLWHPFLQEATVL